VTRNQFKSLPIPDNVIAHMNKLADTQANSPAAVLDFRMGSESTYFKLADIDAHSTESDDFLTNLVDIDEPRLVSADDAIHEQDEILIEERADSNVHISDFLIHDETTAHTTSTEMNTAYSEELSQPLNPVHTSPPTPDRRVHWATDVVTPPDNLLVAPPRTDRVLRSALRADTRIHWDSRTGGVKNATLYSTKQPLAFIEPTSLADRPVFDFHTMLHTSLKRSLRDPVKGVSAQTAMDAELTNMLTKQVLRPLHKHQQTGMKFPIRSHMFIKEKHKPDGTFDRTKARLVGNGNMQNRDEIQPEDIASPTASLPFLLTVASIAAQEHRVVKTADVPVAYLNAGTTKHLITVILDPLVTAALVRLKPEYKEFVHSNGTMVCQLLRALYGCVESAKLWYNLLRSSKVMDSK
jgi:hypothetical protein